MLDFEYVRDIASACTFRTPCIYSAFNPTGSLIIRIQRIRCKADHLTVLVAAFLIQASEVLLSVKFNSKGYGCKHNLGLSLKRTVTAA